MADITFVFHSKWYETLKDLPIEQQDKVLADLVRHGIEEELRHNGDPVIKGLVAPRAEQIDFSKKMYQQKLDAGIAYGRKKTVSDEAIHRLAREGKRANEIAEALGYSVSSVNHSVGWKRRNFANLED